MKSLLLKSLFLLCILSAVFCFIAKAQIVYTDVNPDVSYSPYDLDLNNDGIVDFILKVTQGTDHCHGFPPYNFCSGTIPTDKTTIKPISNNEVAQDIGNSLPSALNANSLINSLLIFNNGTNQELVATSAGCYGNFCGPVAHGNWSGVNWSGVMDKYLGLRISVDSDYYYGWARLDVAGGGTGFTIKDYAYNSIPNQSILAGDTENIATGIHIVKGFSSIAISPNPFQHLIRISFSFPQTEKISVIICDLTGRIITVLSNEIMPAGNHQLGWNATDNDGNAVGAGIYFLTIQSPSFFQTEKLMVTK